MNLLLAVDVGQWILLGVLVLILVVSPFLMKAKNKKEMENAQKLMDSIKKGDKVLTASGVIGKVISIDTKEGYKAVTIETGDEKHKGYITIDIAAVYANLSNPVVEQKSEQPNKAEKVEETKEKVEKTEVKVEEEQPQQAIENESKEEVETVEEVKSEDTTKKSKKKKN